MILNQLEANLKLFFQECANREHPLLALKLVRSDLIGNTHQYFIEVTTDWIEPENYLVSINFLADLLLKTTALETRGQILAIIVRDKDGNLLRPDVA